MMRLSSEPVMRRFDVKEMLRIGAEWAAVGVARQVRKGVSVGEREQDDVPGKEEMRAPDSASKRVT